MLAAPQYDDENGVVSPAADSSTSSSSSEEEEESTRRGGVGGTKDEDSLMLAKKNAALASALRQKTEQLKRMGIMLEALSPLQGVSASRLLNAIDNVGPVDLRDQKIVQLARKCRNLSVALQREREETKRLKELPPATVREEEYSPAPLPEPTRPQALNRKREMQLAKQVAELRSQLQRSREEIASLKRTLAKEVGNGGDAVLSEGWRGRAQQIVMLKARIKKLEAEHQDGVAPRKYDVDDRAQADLQDMERQRQRAVEMLTEQHAALQGELQDARKKIEAGRARSESLLADCARNRDHIRLLLDKTQGDDALIDELRAHVATLQDQLRRRHQ